MTIEALRDQVDACKTTLARAVAAVGAAEVELEAATAALLAATRQDVHLRRPSAPSAVRGPHAASRLPLEIVRDAVVALRVFVTSELASELDCSKTQARFHVARVGDIVRKDGFVGGEQCYAYVEPDAPAASDGTPQQRRRKPESLVAVGDLAAARGSAVHLGADVRSLPCKELRPIVREATKHGWVLEHSGGNHPMRLVRGKQIIGLPSTPRSPGDAANTLRRELRRAA